jgi:hypothetical protein
MSIKSGRGRLSSTNSLTEKTLRNCPCEYAAWPPSCQSPTCQRPTVIRPVPDFESIKRYSAISEVCSQSCAFAVENIEHRGSRLLSYRTQLESVPRAFSDMTQDCIISCQCEVAHSSLEISPSKVQIAKWALVHPHAGRIYRPFSRSPRTCALKIAIAEIARRCLLCPQKRSSPLCADFVL